MNDHPTDSLPAYVLGALEPSEAEAIAEHLRACPACHAEAEEFRDIVTALPYSVPAHEPPPHVKRQLFARIHARADAPAPAPVQQPRPAPARSAPRQFGWIGAVATLAVVLMLAFGAMMVDARLRLDEVSQELHSLQTPIAASSEAQQIAAFLSAPETLSQPMTPAVPGVAGNMFMQAGNTQAVLVVHGLQAPEPGTTYQFWFAGNGIQVPSSTFTVDPAGTVQVLLAAPAPVNSYEEVMVTVEPAGGSTLPSSEVVLASKLHA